LSKLNELGVLRCGRGVEKNKEMKRVEIVERIR